MAKVWAIVFIHVGAILVVASYFAAASSLWPRLTERASARFARRAWLPALIGVAVSLPWVFGALLLLQEQGGRALVGIVVGLGWVAAGLVGAAAIAVRVGAGAEETSTRPAAIRGGVILSLCWSLPVLGWYFVAPLTLATGVGCLLVGLRPVKSAPVIPPIQS